MVHHRGLCGCQTCVSIAAQLQQSSHACAALSVACSPDSFLPACWCMMCCRVVCCQAEAQAQALAQEAERILQLLTNSGGGKLTRQKVRDRHCAEHMRGTARQARCMMLLILGACVSTGGSCSPAVAMYVCVLDTNVACAIQWYLHRVVLALEAASTTTKQVCMGCLYCCLVSTRWSSWSASSTPSSGGAMHSEGVS